MSRQARIEYPGAVHHVCSRGNDRQAVFLDDRDRIHFLALLAEAVRHYGWLLTAWVLMTNHFHLVLANGLPHGRESGVVMESQFEVADARVSFSGSTIAPTSES